VRRLRTLWSRSADRPGRAILSACPKTRDMLSRPTDVPRYWRSWTTTTHLASSDAAPPAARIWLPT